MAEAEQHPSREELIYDWNETERRGAVERKRGCELHD